MASTGAPTSDGPAASATAPASPGAAAADTAPPPPPPPQAAPGEATLLVSEFPPPPYYFRQALGGFLSPPPIPHDALSRGTVRAAAAAAAARAESERLRLAEEQDDHTQAFLGGEPAKPPEETDDGDVVAVFGEIVEDPLLFQPLDPCEDPRVVREEVKRLNQQVVSGFVKLVQDLVERPMDNKRTRDELSHNVFLMLQECNKFREHQAREILIELLEKQLTARHELLTELQTNIAEADTLLREASPTTTTAECHITASTGNVEIF